MRRCGTTESWTVGWATRSSGAQPTGVSFGTSQCPHKYEVRKALEGNALDGPFQAPFFALYVFCRSSLFVTISGTICGAHTGIDELPCMEGPSYAM